MTKKRKKRASATRTAKQRAPKKRRPKKRTPMKPGPAKEEIQAARERYGFTQKEAGELIYYSLPGWQRLEYGKRAMQAALWEYWQLRATQAYAAKKASEPLAAS